jgi:hypothetical protein
VKIRGSVCIFLMVSFPFLPVALVGA